MNNKTEIKHVYEILNDKVRFEIVFKKIKYDVFVDLDDWENIKYYKWTLSFIKGKISYIKACSESCYVFLHKFILNKNSNDIVDHKDGNLLNNCKSNLRYATLSQNGANKRISKRNKTGYKGVSWHYKNQKYNVQIMFNYKKIHGGYFTDIIEAAKKYDELAIKYFGEFANLNFPDNIEKGTAA